MVAGLVHLVGGTVLLYCIRLLIHTLFEQQSTGACASFHIREIGCRSDSHCADIALVAIFAIFVFCTVLYKFDPRGQISAIHNFPL